MQGKNNNHQQQKTFSSIFYTYSIIILSIILFSNDLDECNLCTSLKELLHASEDDAMSLHRQNKQYVFTIEFNQRQPHKNVSAISIFLCLEM
jgi:hypothetical protein